MSIRKLRAGRVPTVTADQYIGEIGSIFWDEGTGTLHLSDGVNPGGTILSVQTFTTENVPPHPANGNLWFDEISGNLFIYFEGTWVDTNPSYVLPIAGTNTLGGIKVGPGVAVSSSGILTIDAAGLDVSFGDFTASTNNLSTVNANEDLNLLSNGTGGINVVGKLHIHSTSGGLNDIPVVSVDENGFTVVHVPTIGLGQTGLLVNGDGGTINSATLPQVSGTTFRSIGNDGMMNALTVDANGTGMNAGVTARVARGTAAAPTAIKAGDTFARYAGVGFGDTNYVIDTVSGRAPTDMRFVATEDYTDAHGGSKVQFFTSPTGGIVKTLSAEILPTGIKLPTNTSITFPDSSVQTTAFIPTALPAPLLPAEDNTVDLGSPDKRFRNLYLGPASLFIADSSNPSVNVDISVNNGTLYIAGAQNLAVGDLVIQGTTLKTVNPEVNINIGDLADTGLATIGRQTVITTPNLGSQTAALLINGATTSPTDPSPLTFNGTMIHTVAQAGQSARIVQDAYGNGNYPIYVGRKAGGTLASPTAPVQGEILLRISANGYGSTGFGTSGSARIDFTTLEQFTDTWKGTRIDFWTTPAGTTAVTNNASVSNDGFVGNGIRFTGDDTYQTTAGIPLTAKAVSNATYVATLGVDGKLDSSQIPSSLTGAIIFKGTWNADTNTPALSDSLPAGLTTGWEYIVEVGGTQDIGDGSKTFLAGDFVIYDGTHWKQVPSGNAFISLSSGGHITVNQTTGVMTLGSDATPLSTFSTIVSRDSSGNFSANVITANLTGNVTGSVSGNAGTVTNGVYTTGDQTIAGIKTFTAINTGKIAATNSSSSTSTTGAISYGTNSYTDTGLMANFTSSIAGYNQVIIQNTSAATTASANLILSNNLGTATTNYGEIGINSSTFTGSGSANIPGAVYIGAANGDLVFGTNTNKAIHFYTNSSTTDALTISGAGVATFTQTIVGSINGNAGTVTNGVVTTGSYSDPSWLTISAAKVGLGNVTNESKATMFTSPTFTGTTSGITATMVGLGNVTNESKATMFTSPTFTGTVAGVTKAMVGLGNVENTALSTSTHFIGTTSITYNRASGAQTLNGVSIDGNAGTVTNGVYTTDTGTVTNTMLAGSIANNKLANSSITVNGTAIALGASGTVTAAAGTLTGTTLNSTVVTSSLTSVGTLTNLAIATGGTITTPRVVINDGGLRTVTGGTTLTIDFSSDSIVLLSVPTGNVTITLTNYTAGSVVRVLVRFTTARNIAMGVASGVNSTTGGTTITGTGGGAQYGANQTVQLVYTCIDGTSTNTYVAASYV